AMLLAAISLGSTSALHQLRDALDDARPAGAAAITALAVAGEAGDAARLLALAARAPELAAQATLAAAHLGDPATADAIAGAIASGDAPEGPAAIDEAVTGRARRTILGDDALTGRSVPVAGAADARRLLYGAPWTLAGALARLK